MADLAEIKIKNDYHDITTAKISVPQFENILLRTRLFAVLDKYKKKPAIFISSPPGSGKTTLYSSFINYFKINCIWYQIDDRDNDVSTFFYYFSSAVKKANPEKEIKLPLYSGEYSTDISKFSKFFFEKLFYHMQKPLTIVFDNYNEINADAKLHEIIKNGMEIIPEGINIVFLSRNEMPSLFKIFQVNNKMELIKFKDLKLNSEEICRLISIYEDSGYSIEDSKAIQSIFNGWIAGIILMLKNKKEIINEKILNEFIPELLFDYYNLELFNRMPDEIKDFLLKTSIFRKFTTSMSLNLTYNKKAEQFLSYAVRNNLFIEKHFNIEPVYQYHSLFRNFLLEQLKNNFSSAELNIFKKKAADILIETGQTEEAFNLYLEIKDWSNLEMIIIDNAHALMLHYRVQVLLKWIDSIPQDFLESNPWLLYWHGMCHIPLDTEKGAIYFEKAFYIFKENAEIKGIILSLAGIIDSIVMGFENFGSAEKWIPVFYDLYRKINKYPDLELEAEFFYSFFIILSLNNVNLSDFDEILNRCLLLLEKSRDINNKIKGISYILYYLIRAGNYIKAQSILLLIKSLEKKQAITQLNQLLIKWHESFFQLNFGSNEECAEIIRDALDFAKKNDLMIALPGLLGYGIINSVNIGDFEAADEYADLLSDNLSSFRKLELHLYHFALAWKSLVADDFVSAQFHCNEALKLAESSNAYFTSAMSYLEYAIVQFTLKNYNKGKEYIIKARNSAFSMKSSYVEFMTLAYEAYFTFENNEKEALELLKNALKIGKNNGFYNLYLWHNKYMTKLFIYALENNIEIDYVKEFIKRKKILSTDDSIYIADWPWQLKLYTLGEFKIIKNDKLFQFNGKAPKKPVELLKAIISFGSININKNLLCDALWPDQRGDLAFHSFETTLYRLRKLIRNEDAVLLSFNHVSLNLNVVWIDAVFFEHCCSLLENAFRQNIEINNKALQLIERALEIFKGDYLKEEIDLPWAINMREKCRLTYIRLIRNIGEYYEKQNSMEKVKKIYEKALDINCLAEEFYQKLMKCCIAAGYKSEAVFTYNRCVENFKAFLNTTPSQETELIYKSLFA